MIPGIVLMENAGRGCAEKLMSLGAAKGAVICCGGGNNGGDGFVIARQLYNRGIVSKVILFSRPEDYGGDARINLNIIERLPIPIVQFDPEWKDESIIQHLTTIGREKAAWIVDAMLGTGAVGELRSPFDRLIPLMNELPIKRMAIDIPTGMDCDTGMVQPTAFQADITCTFIDFKRGFANPDAANYLGHVSVVGIGAPRDIIRVAAADRLD